MEKLWNNKRTKRMAVFLVAVITGFLFRFPVSAADDTKKEPMIMVSLGDSYSSGEGVEPFYGQDESDSKKVKNEDWLAHRSENSWSSKLILDVDYTTEGDHKVMGDCKDEYWYFQASSGAVTENLKYTQLKEYNRSSYEGKYYVPPQLNIFKKLEKNSADYVTMTIGGNDADFAGVVTKVATTTRFQNCNGLEDKLADTWEYFYTEGGIKDKLIDAYADIEKAAGKQASIIIAGYPTLFDESKDKESIAETKVKIATVLSATPGVFVVSTLEILATEHERPATYEEAKMVNSNVVEFNKHIKNIVECCAAEGMNIHFVSVENAFAGHEAYSENPYINPILLLPQPQDLNSVKPPSSYSMHPNLQGQELYARCVQAKINQLELEKVKAAQAEAEENTATEDEKTAEEIKFSGMVINPEDVVLKLFDAMQNGDYDKTAECMNPTLEKQLNFIGGIASTLTSLLTGEYTTWGKLAYQIAGTTDMSVIEYSVENLYMESDVPLLGEVISNIPKINKMLCTEADVYVTLRYKSGDEYRTIKELFRVRRYGSDGWRIDEEIILGGQ